ncbi:hypothetical protein F4802DRAFT_83279 [Xylaria palmicola]|nr:hypothetical protein F4802DRAFT_83279 [Xylaria palmicola]
MCRYRKSIFQCNCTQLSPEALTLCAVQQAYLAGGATEPCGLVTSHTCATVRVPRLCGTCGAKKAALDRTFAEVKRRMAGLRRHLDESYGDCMKHMDESFGERKGKGKGKGKEKKTEKEKGETATKAETEPVDPVEAFLRKKRAEKHANLMMLGSY